MRPHIEVFKRVQKNPGGYFYPGHVTFAAVVAFVQGYDLACEGGVLAGFREWLVVRLGNVDLVALAWPALVLHAAFPDSMNIRSEVIAPPEHERKGIDTLWELLFEFEAILEQRRLNSIFSAYYEWFHAKCSEDLWAWPTP